MRKLVLVLTMLLSLIGYSQEIPKQNSESFKWDNGYGELVDVVFENLDPDKVITQEAIKSITISTLVDCKYNLKNKLSFVPVKLNLMPFEGNIASTLIYRGKNAYGNEKEIKSIYIYSMSGEKLRKLK